MENSASLKANNAWPLNAPGALEIISGVSKMYVVCEISIQHVTD